MITISAVFKNGSAQPESIPETKFGNYFDGVNYYYFESQEELTTWRQQQKEQPQVPIEDAFFEEENIFKVWEALINSLDKLPVELIEKLKEVLIK
jgi:hypothetical protein